MKKTIIDVFKILLISFIIELTLFNIMSYVSFFRRGAKKEISINEDDFIYTDNENEVIIALDNINDKVKTVKINIDEHVNLDMFEYKIGYSDETSKEIMWMQNSKFLLKDNEKSKYINCFLSGNVSKIWVLVDKTSVENEMIKSIVINENIPFEINTIRFLSVAGILILIYAIKNTEKIYNVKNLKQEIILLIIVFVAIVLCTQLNKLSNYNELDFYSKDFVDAVKQKQVYLLRDDSEKLEQLEDPYDSIDRANNLERGEEFLWDVAYYKGKYYVYFGIVPILTLFLPFNLITKTYLTSRMAILLYSALCLIILKELYLLIINKYFKNLSFKIVVLGLLILCFGSSILFLNGVPAFYEVAIISGLFFSLLGIFCILQSEKENKIKFLEMFFGAVFLALSVGCRPTCLLISLIILPLLFKILIYNIKNKNKKEIIKEVLAIGIPYIVIGALLMYYNYIRFDSIFEFGASYQLTVNNMEKLSSRIFSIPKGVIYNLFSIPVFTDTFPYIGHHNDFSFNGYYYIENMVGGLFVLAPICFFNVFIYKLFKKKKCNILGLIVLQIVGIMYCILSVAMAGSTQRYISDYAWIFILAGLIIFFDIYMSLKSEESKKILEKILLAITIYTVIINISVGIISESEAIKNNSPKDFRKIEYSICFWK